MKKKNSFIRIFTYMHKNIIFYFGGLILVGVNLAVFQIVLASMFRYLFDKMELGEFNNIFNGIRNYLILMILLLAILPVFNYIVGRIGVLTSANLRKTISYKFTKLPVSYFKTHHSGDTISRCTNDISETEKSYQQYLPQFIATLIMGILTTAFTFYLEWRLGLLTIVSGLFVLFVNMFYAKILRHISTEVQEKLARLNERFSNIIAGIQVIKVFNIQKIILNKFYDSNEDVYHKSKERVRKQAVMDALNFMVSFITVVGISMYGAYLSINGIITFGVIIAVVQLQNGITNLVFGLGRFITQMQSSLAASDRVFELLDTKEEPESYHLEQKGDKQVNDAVYFDNIVFSYEDAKDELVLNHLSLSLPRNKVYALVGPSGGGKSTVFKLILNFYPPNEGNIYINGKSISDQKIEEIRKQIAYVPQDAHLFTGTIAENIRYGRMDATMDEIIEAAKSANAHDFIMELDQGYETEAGENGTDLSGGQRQRIAIARAFLNGAPLLLLDEATSALDSESEILVQEALEKLMVNKTTLIIAHRLSTIQHADQILVISDGVVVEKGKHLELLEKTDGIYTKLYNQQFVK